MIIANPIYDAVFKYLMEDERIARTILSALLKKDVVAVDMRPHEYSNNNYDSLAVFRIDFGATIRDEDGKESLLLIELQKTWLETETLRFRQYLGVHYSNPKNMKKDGKALPMVAVYLLGHKVGDIEEPVVYVNKQINTYDCQLVTKGIPDPFIDSLTHESIIVQIPRLHGQVNNRLEKVLSIFDQTRMDKDDTHVLRFDDGTYDGDTDMARIMHRLTMAASDSDMRHRMNVEDEYFSAIEKRDTEILLRDKQLAEQKTQISEQKAQLTEQKVQLTEQKAQLTEQKAQLTEQKAQLTEQKAQLTEQKAQLTEQKAQITEQKAQITEQKAQITEQKAQLALQEDLLRTTVRMLLQSGQSIEDIASSLGMNQAMVKRLAE